MNENNIKIHSGSGTDERAEDLRRMKRKKRRQESRRAFHLVMAGILVCFILAFLLINLFVPTKDFSADENRTLAARPALTWETVKNGKFFSAFDTYYSDQFVGRPFWMKVKTAGLTLLGEKESGDVYFGRDGYLLGKPVTPDRKAEERTVTAVNAFAAANPDLTQTMILVPDAATVLSKELPANAPVRDQKQDIEDFEKQLTGVQRVDAYAALSAAAGKEQVFYRTDHHWTSGGAKAVFDAAAPALGIESPVSTYDIYTVTTSFEGTLSSKSGNHRASDSIEIYAPQGTDVEYYVNYPDLAKKSASLYMKDKLSEKDQYQVFFGGNHPLVEIRTTAGNGRNLLVFKDSYANSFIQFLTPYYSKIILVDPRYYYEDIGATASTYGITDVLYLYSADTLLTDTGLADTLSAEASE